MIYNSGWQLGPSILPFQGGSFAPNRSSWWSHKRRVCQLLIPPPPLCDIPRTSNISPRIFSPNVEHFRITTQPQMTPRMHWGGWQFFFWRRLFRLGGFLTNRQRITANREKNYRLLCDHQGLRLGANDPPWKVSMDGPNCQPELWNIRWNIDRNVWEPIVFNEI